MSKQLVLTAHDKARRYQEVLPQLYAVLKGETDLIANLANTVAILKEAFGFFWVGFYIAREAPEKQLVLAPFQGPLACTRIGFGKGVCGQAWSQAKTLIVPDVNAFPGHIACSSLSRSEIVVPVFSADTHMVVAVLDIDSTKLNAFDQTDQMYLEQLSSYLSQYWPSNVSRP